MIKSSARSSTDLDPRPQPAGRRHGGWFSHHRDQRRGRPHHPLRRRLHQERRPPRRPGTPPTCRRFLLSTLTRRADVERLLNATYGHSVSRRRCRVSRKKRVRRVFANSAAATDAASDGAVASATRTTPLCVSVSLRCDPKPRHFSDRSHRKPQRIACIAPYTSRSLHPKNEIKTTSRSPSARAW